MNFRNRFRGRAVRRVPGEMNKTERAYSSYLEQLVLAGEVLEYHFDAIKLRLADKTFYEPDFLVVAKDESIEIHEVKGTMFVRELKGGMPSRRAKPLVEDDAAVKIKVAAAKFPFRFKMVWREPNGNWRSDAL